MWRISPLLFTLFIISPSALAASATGAPDTGAMNALLHAFEQTAGQWPPIILGVCAHFSEKSNVSLQPFIYKGWQGSLTL